MASNLEQRVAALEMTVPVNVPVSGLEFVVLAPAPHVQPDGATAWAVTLSGRDFESLDGEGEYGFMARVQADLAARVRPPAKRRIAVILTLAEAML